MRNGDTGSWLAVDPVRMEALIEGIGTAVAAAENAGHRPVLVCAAQLRVCVRRLLATARPDLKVLSYSELSRSVLHRARRGDPPCRARPRLTVPPTTGRRSAAAEADWPTPGTLVFTGADLEAAVAAAFAELGPDVDVRAARSVKQGLRGRTHVEVLVADPHDSGTGTDRRGRRRRRCRRPRSGRRPAGSADAPRVRRRPGRIDARRAARVGRGRGAGVHRSTGPSSQAGRLGTSRRPCPFEAPHWPGNPSFAAEFAAAFPAALAAARAAEDGDRAPCDGVRRRSGPARGSTRMPDAVAADFTARVRDALQRVPQEDEPEPADDAAEELQVDPGRRRARRIRLST